jgi:hypothetical protein
MVLGWLLFPLTLERFLQLDFQAFVWPNKVVVGQPPAEMLVQFRWEVSRSPSSAGEFGNRLANDRVDSLYEGSIDDAAQAKGFQASGIFCGQPLNHTLFYLDQTFELMISPALLRFGDFGGLSFDGITVYAMFHW